MIQKITIFGSSGFLGSRLIKYLEEHGHTVFTPQKGDLSIFDRDLGYVFYCIGKTANFAENPYATIEAHVTFLSEILFKACFDAFLYLSSVRLYDCLSGIVNEDSNLHLNPNNPRHLYDFTKATGEVLCLHHPNKSVKVARLSTVYDLEKKADIYPWQIYNNASQNKTKDIELDSSENVARDYISIEDVMNLVLKILTNGKHRLYNVASGKNISNRQWADVIEKKTGCKLIFKKSNSDVYIPTIDISRCQEEFNFKPYDLLEQI